MMVVWFCLGDSLLNVLTFAIGPVCAEEAFATFGHSGLSASVIKQYLEGIHWHHTHSLMLSTPRVHFLPSIQLQYNTVGKMFGTIGVETVCWTERSRPVSQSANTKWLGLPKKSFELCDKRWTEWSYEP